MNNRNRNSFMWIAVIALAFCLSSSARAQFSASLTGTVQDSTGAIIPKATATLINLGTQQTQTAGSADSGAYRFDGLAPGHYKLVVTATGFKNFTFEDIQLAAETPRNLNVTLVAGGASDTITVSASDTPVLQTSDASIQQTIDSNEIQKLPISGADPYELVRIAPGITGDGARAGNGNAVFLPNSAGPGGSNSGIFQTENQVQISADGQRTANNNYMIDGVSVNSLSHGGSAVVTPNSEAVSQITVVSTSYDASDGRNSGAQIKSVTKSGTNDLHGSLFFLYDEPGLNAYNKWGGPTGGKPLRVSNKQRTYAASLGGPIVKNKLFAFGSFQGYGQGSNGTSIGWVETDQYRAAVQAARPGGVTSKIFSSAGIEPRIVSVLNRGCLDYSANQGMYPGQTASTGNWCHALSSGIDIGSPTSGGASQIGVYPRFTRPSPAQASQEEVGGGFDGVPDLQYVQLSVPGHSRGKQFNGRIDFQATQKDLIAGSTYFTKLDTFGSANVNSRPQGDDPFKPLNSAGTLIYIHTFSASVLNELRGNFTRFADNGVKDGGGIVNYGIPEAHTEGLPINQIQFGLPQSVGNFFAQNTYEVRDTLSKIFGSHVIRVGVEVRREQDNDNTVASQIRPVYSFRGLWNLANDTPIFEGIIANPNTGGPPTVANHLRSENYAAFIQHDWKVTPQFTLNTGLRWELFTPLRNKDSQLSYPVLGGPGRELVDVKLVPRDRLWNTQYKNFGPKIGFAYNPTALQGKMVLRGGFALAYNHLDFALFNVAQQDNGPGLAKYGLCCGTPTDWFSTPFADGTIKYAVGTSNSPTSYPFNPALATGTGANGFPNPYGPNKNLPGTEVYGALPNTQVPYSFLYSLETQFELPHQLTTTVGYAGSLGRHYARLVNQNFIYNQSVGSANSPAGSGLYMARTDSVMAYNALNLQLQRHLSNNFTASITYTYAKSLDQVSNGDQANALANQTNPANNASEYGPSDYDVKHRVTATALWELPHVHSDSMLVKALTNGWQINGIATYHTGFPWTPVTFSLNSVPNNPTSATISPVRPLQYFGGAGNDCSSDAFKTGSNFPGGGTKFFSTTLPTGKTYTPGIGRNSFRGPCYFDLDMSVAKEVKFETLGRNTLLRFQANAYNAFNSLSLQPIKNGNGDGGANIQSSQFGESSGANSGRVIEFLARFQF